MSRRARIRARILHRVGGDVLVPATQRELRGLPAPGHERWQSGLAAAARLRCCRKWTRDRKAARPRSDRRRKMRLSVKAPSDYISRVYEARPVPPRFEGVGALGPSWSRARRFICGPVKRRSSHLLRRARLTCRAAIAYGADVPPTRAGSMRDNRRHSASICSEASRSRGARHRFRPSPPKKPAGYSASWCCTVTVSSRAKS